MSDQHAGGLNRKARKALAERGWLTGIQVLINEPVELSELACPECESDDLIQYEKADLSTVITCVECSEEHEFTFRELVGDHD